jgi:hypothetical protein
MNDSPIKRRGLRLIVAGIVAAVVLAVVAVVALTAGSSAPIAAHGTVATTTGLLSGDTPEEAFPDIATGGQVVVVNSAGTVIGTGTLGQAEVANAGEVDYRWSVRVPAGLPRYGVRIGRDRGTVYYSAAQMASGPALCVGEGC